MLRFDPANTFRGLPLTAEQDREIRHYVHTRQRAGAAWDTAELKAMLADMLSPPETVEEESGALSASLTEESAAAARQWTEDRLQDGEQGPDAADRLA